MGLLSAVSNAAAATFFLSARALGGRWAGVSQGLFAFTPRFGSSTGASFWAQSPDSCGVPARDLNYRSTPSRIVVAGAFLAGLELNQHASIFFTIPLIATIIARRFLLKRKSLNRFAWASRLIFPSNQCGGAEPISWGDTGASQDFGIFFDQIRYFGLFQAVALEPIWAVFAILKNALSSHCFGCSPGNSAGATGPRRTQANLRVTALLSTLAYLWFLRARPPGSSLGLAVLARFCSSRFDSFFTGIGSRAFFTSQISRGKISWVVFFLI